MLEESGALTYQARAALGGRPGVCGDVLLILLATFGQKGVKVMCPGMCCCDLADTPAHPQRAPAHSMQVEGDINHRYSPAPLTPENACSPQRAPTAL